MKEQWWLNKAVELQQAADRRDMKAFYSGLRAVYGTRDSGSIPVRSLNGTTLITVRAGILNRWAEHFQSVLNQESKFDQSVLDEIPQWNTADALIDPIEPAEVEQAINQMSAGKSPGEDGQPVEQFKTGGVHLQQKLLTIFKDIWHQHAVPQ